MKQCRQRNITKYVIRILWIRELVHLMSDENDSLYCRKSQVTNHQHAVQQMRLLIVLLESSFIPSKVALWITTCSQWFMLYERSITQLHLRSSFQLSLDFAMLSNNQINICSLCKSKDVKSISVIKIRINQKFSVASSFLSLLWMSWIQFWNRFERWWCSYLWNHS